MASIIHYRTPVDLIWSFHCVPESPKASVFHVHDKFVFVCDMCEPKNHCAPNIPGISFTVKIICPFSYLRHQDPSTHCIMGLWDIWLHSYCCEIRQRIALWDIWLHSDHCKEHRGNVNETIIVVNASNEFALVSPMAKLQF